jgi:choline dehydrogenase
MYVQIGEGAAFARATDVTLCPAGESEEALADEASAPDAPDLEIIFTPMCYTEHLTGIALGDLVGIQAILLRPQSQGTVRLRSADAFTPPAIDPGYLNTENDMRVLVRGVRLACRVGAALARAGVVSDAPEPGLDGDLHLRSDAEMMEVVSGRLETIYHAACTTRMGPRADGAVVDGRLRVYGVKGLRIADAGVMPRLVAGHTVREIALGEDVD